jgi:GT2 family glycosyltransferase
MTEASIGVYIATYGDQSAWEPLAARALMSVGRQTLKPSHHSWYHGSSLHEARNAMTIGTDRPEWLCFLDADDELDPHFIEAMAAAIDGLEGDWLLQPATLGVYSDGREDPEPALIPRADLLTRNFMVISTLIRSSQFQRLGGFDDWPALEDWDLWLRARRDGAQYLAVPDAVLRVHVNANSRNNPSPALAGVGRAIRERHQGVGPC